jgi:hypothetical protein
MATKSQRKQQKVRRQQRKRLKERQRKKGNVLQGNSRHRQRLALQKPRSWKGEILEDVAVFDDSVLESLSPELASQVSAVREALEAACESRGDEALKCVSGVSRNSPLSQWRLFIRGLVPWTADDTEAASEAWKRLAPERRPGRIAIAMMCAHLTDLDRVSVAESNREPNDDREANWCSRLDDQLLYHAKLLRRVRIDRAAIRVAEVAVRAPEEAKELRLGPKKIEWLRDFATEFRSTEPDLVAALEHIALGRAFAQNFSDLFETAIKAFVGPRHDRRNSLLSYFYYLRFEDDQSSDLRLEKYLTKDLPKNEEVSAPLRDAIASQIHLDEAMMMIRPAGGGVMAFMFGEREDTKAINRHFEASVRAYPVNRPAYKEHVDWIESKLDNSRLTKPERKPLETRLAEVMENWSKGLPDDVEPRLWLVDYLLENEETEEAKPHVDRLAAARQDDPRVRATPWKWQLLEAMRLSRRKAWLPEVLSKLEKAESQWPAWLSKQWLPYLKAAWSLRCGKTDEFEQQRQQICNESGITKDSLADACMMLGAAQRMRVSAADLKPLREPVDAAVKNISKLSYDELLLASGFFWDLHRTQLLYPAYRMHGGKFAKELFSRFNYGPGLVLNHVDDERLHAAILLCSEHRFWSDGYELKLPVWYSKPDVQRHSMFAAARLNAFLKLRVHWRSEDFKDIGPILRHAAQSQRDPYYRHWFVSLADELDEILAKDSSPFGSGFNPFSRLFADDDDDDDDDDLDFDPDCDCPRCRAAKRAYEASR